MMADLSSPNSSKQESVPSGCGDQLNVPAGQERRAFDLGDHRRPTTDLRRRDAADERKSTIRWRSAADRQAQRACLGEERELLGRAAAATGRLPLANTVTLRWRPDAAAPPAAVVIRPARR
jgi:hypothetical protein